MVDIIKILDEFQVEIARFKSEIANPLSTVDKKIEQLNNQREEMAKEKEALDDREAEIKKIENIVALEASARAMMKEAQEKMSELIEAKDSFENNRIAITKELNTLRAELDNKGAYIKKEYKILQKMQKDLETEKATFKDKVAKSIVDLANKK